MRTRVISSLAVLGAIALLPAGCAQDPTVSGRGDAAPPSSIGSQSSGATTDGTTNGGTTEDPQSGTLVRDGVTLVDAYLYSLPATDYWTDYQGYWFANADHTVVCYVLDATNLITEPHVSCNLTEEVPLEPTAEETKICEDTAGAWAGWTNSLFTDRAQIGQCQSDIPIGVLCHQDPSASDYCAENWFGVPVLEEGTAINNGRFRCDARSGRFYCTSKGARLAVADGWATTDW